MYEFEYKYTGYSKKQKTKKPKSFEKYIQVSVHACANHSAKVLPDLVISFATFII